MMQLFTDMAEEGQLLILGDESSVQTGVEQKTTREFDTVRPSPQFQTRRS